MTVGGCLAIDRLAQSLVTDGRTGAQVEELTDQSGDLQKGCTAGHALDHLLAHYASGGYSGLWMVNMSNALLDNFGGGTR